MQKDDSQVARETHSIIEPMLQAAQGSRSQQGFGRGAGSRRSAYRSQHERPSQPRGAGRSRRETRDAAVNEHSAAKVSNHRRFFDLNLPLLKLKWQLEVPRAA